MKRFARFASLVLLVCMVFSMFATSAFAVTYCEKCGGTSMTKMCLKNAKTYGNDIPCGISSDCTWKYSRAIAVDRCNKCSYNAKSYGYHQEAKLHSVSNHSSQICRLPY